MNERLAGWALLEREDAVASLRPGAQPADSPLLRSENGRTVFRALTTPAVIEMGVHRFPQIVRVELVGALRQDSHEIEASDCDVQWWAWTTPAVRRAAASFAFALLDHIRAVGVDDRNILLLSNAAGRIEELFHAGSLTAEALTPTRSKLREAHRMLEIEWSGCDPAEFDRRFALVALCGLLVRATDEETTFGMARRVCEGWRLAPAGADVNQLLQRIAEESLLGLETSAYRIG